MNIEPITEAERVQIAETCGWTHGTWAFDCYRGPAWRSPNKQSYVCFASELPNYPSSLDAMHEAEKVLNAEQQLEYARLLHELFRGQRHYLHIDFDVLHATAAQRCRAFLTIIDQEK